MIEMPKFMPWLMKRFQSLGGTIQQKKVNGMEELLGEEFQPDLIVNCTGLGK